MERRSRNDSRNLFVDLPFSLSRSLPPSPPLSLSSYRSQGVPPPSRADIPGRVPPAEAEGKRKTRQGLYRRRRKQQEEEKEEEEGRTGLSTLMAGVDGEQLRCSIGQTITGSIAAATLATD